MAITVSVTCNGMDIGKLEFVAIPREGEVVKIDEDEGEVQRIEHVVGSGRPAEVKVFINDEP